MYLCNAGHEEIVHETYGCPLCVQIELNTALSEKVSDLEAKVDDLESELAELA